MGIAPGTLGPLRSLWMLLGTWLCVASANALNCFIERESDKRMVRTSKRPLPAGRLDPNLARAFGLLLGVVSLPILALGTNLITGVLGLVALLTVLEELTWRGLVLTDLTERLGTRRAWPIAAILYGACHAPTLFLLSQPGSSPNALVVLGALGAGIVWSFMASLLGRLPPVIVSHAVFSYFAVAVLLPRLG